jgi:hypothetical protein
MAKTSDRDQSATSIGLVGAHDRIAVSADGNFRDEDDIGATPMTFAILTYAGALDRLVYYGHRNHIWPAETRAARRVFKGRTQEARMRTSVVDSIVEFKLNRSIIVDEKASFERSGQASQQKLVDEINASGPNNRLWIIGAGPMMTVFASLKAANADSIKYIALVSHSNSNNQHAESHTPGVKWNEIQRFIMKNGGSLYCGASTCDGATVKAPRDQNKGLDFRSAQWRSGGKPNNSVWQWMQRSTDTRLNFVYDRIVDSNVADVSDAGMMYYILTGDENTSPDKLRKYMAT